LYQLSFSLFDPAEFHDCYRRADRIPAVPQDRHQGVLAALTSPRIAIAVAGVLLLATPLLLPRRAPVPRPDVAPQAAGLEQAAA
jgi:hypothetical protein